MIEEDLCAIGFMFDAEHDREERTIEFNGDIVVKIKTIGDKPGHVQSGQYLWPAAKAAGVHIIENWHILRSEHILELGAGCGLSGIVASKLDGVASVVWTDYDRGSLQLIEENSRVNCRCKCFVQHLEWGKPIDAETRSINEYPAEGFDLVIGSDLIYCKEVIDPLFRTVSEVLSSRGTFMLVSSFQLNEDFESAINAMCTKLKIKREEQVPLDESAGVSKVEYYRRSSGS